MGKQKDVPVDSDSDFETPKAKKCSSVNRNPKKTSAQKKKKLPKSNHRLLILIQPIHLCNLMKDLTEEQITVVGQMGFASIQHLKVLNIPSCLGLWLLKKYDHNTNTFNMRNCVVNITRELVRDVLGIPMGSNEVSEMKKVSYKNTTEINDTNIKVGFDLSQYDISCSMMAELEPCLNGSVKSVSEPQ
ncbi:hypothetical protein L1987_53450 [Smallanthus sonchifolius]|uniref:Uncharacterized protein n=1 Tax=Smallanthus sonchifolius TaxID=185202 RepID=A0ACB9EVM8_9ASTR|nr:hypothetical protein L1987_53450 [Smallanthus sonchifolius]